MNSRYEGFTLKSYLFHAAKPVRALNNVNVLLWIYSIFDDTFFNN